MILMNFSAWVYSWKLKRRMTLKNEETLKDDFKEWGKTQRWPDKLKTTLKIKTTSKQAGTELGQAQLKLGLDFILIFHRFGFSWFGLVEFVGWIQFCRVYQIDLVWYIWFITFQTLFGRFDSFWRFCLVSLVQ